MNKLIPIIYLVGVLLLILPGFIKTNKNLKIFITNISMWLAIILVILSIYYLFTFLI